MKLAGRSYKLHKTELELRIEAAKANPGAYLLQCILQYLTVFYRFGDEDSEWQMFVFDSFEKYWQIELYSMEASQEAYEQQYCSYYE